MMLLWIILAVVIVLVVIVVSIYNKLVVMRNRYKNAFAQIDAATIETLQTDADLLTSILTYHVVPGKVMSGDLSDGMTAATVEGSEVTIMTEGGVMVNDANVVTADIEASNGVIHAIDTVLMPDM